MIYDIEIKLIYLLKKKKQRLCRLRFFQAPFFSFNPLATSQIDREKEGEREKQ